MLDENQVIYAVCEHLKTSGYKIDKQLHTTEKGVDIVAMLPDQSEVLWIEAKGGTSSRSTSARFGKLYSESQMFDRVAKGLFTASKTWAEKTERNDRIGLAYPDTPYTRKFLNQIKPVIELLGIIVFLVRSDHSVIIFNEYKRREPQLTNATGQ